MCECLRGIFRVTWTPSSNADSDREDSHEHPEARGSPVNNKRRSPPSDRPHHGTHHSLSADEQDSPERIVQKEKLHEELKQVLSQKRSQFYSAPQSSLAEMEEATKTYSKQEQEEEDTQLKDLVEVVVETQAEVGASGYSVVGGGERGIFIQEVLKDSPAAKHLSLQKGDQLLSARVYFDNVKYEDALKILQCAEPYKVSFFLKRTVQGAEINIRPGAQTLELKGPKAKIQRMSVKSVKPFKTKKMRGGRFGLKRLKENKKARAMAELDTEGATGSPVDVEFVLPKFKMRKSGKVPVDESVELQEGISRIKKKKNIRFLKMKATGLAEGEENLGVDALTHKGEVEPSETKLKVKAKGSKFGIHFPKTKKSKLDAQSSSDSPEREPLQSSVELNSPEMKLDANVENEHALDAHVTMPKIKLPKLRLSCHSDEIDGNFIEKPDTPEFKLKKTEIDVKAAEIQDCNVKGTKIKAKYDTQLNLDTKFKLKDDVDGAIVKKQISLPVTDFTISHGEFSDTKVNWPEIDVSLPQMRLTPCKGEEPESKGEGREHLKGNIEFGDSTTGEIHIDKQKVKGKKPKMPTFDEHLPKVDGTEIKTGKIYLPEIDISLPKEKESHSVEIASKGDKLHFPQIELSLPKRRSHVDVVVNTEGQIEDEATMIKENIPSIDISFQKGKTEGKSGLHGGSSEFEMSSSKMKSEGEINIKPPDIRAGKIQIEKPDVDASMAKLKHSSAEIDVEFPNLRGFNMPPIDISLPGGKSSRMEDYEAQTGQGKKSEKPKCDASLPKGGEIEVHGASSKGGKFHIPTVDISLPRGKAGEIDHQKKTRKGKKIELPTLEVPKPKSSASGINVEGPKIKGGDIHTPHVDITIPEEAKEHSGQPNLDIHVSKAQPGGEIHIDSPDVKMGKICTPTIEISSSSEKAKKTKGVKGKKIEMPKFNVSTPKIKLAGDEMDNQGLEIKGPQIVMSTIDVSKPGFPKSDKVKSSGKEIHIESPVIKGGKMHIPSIEISLPAGKAGDVDVDAKSGKGRKFEMPKFNVSPPKIKTPKGKIDVEGPEGGKFHMPTVDISLPGGTGADAGKGKTFEIPTVDVSLPKIKSPEGDVDIDVHGIESERIHIPSVDISLPEGGKGEKLELEAPSGKANTFKIPTVDVSLPKVKSPGIEINTEGLEVKGGKMHMPSIEISLPAGKAGDVEVDAKSGKGRKFEMPKLNVSPSKIKTPKGKIDVEGPEGGKFHVPTVDISLPGGTGADAGPVGKGKTFEIPTVDISMPNIKSPEGEVDIDVHGIKSGGIHIPSVDISLPEGEKGQKIDIEGPSRKGNKFKMPKVDVSLPKMRLSGSEFDTEGSGIKGEKMQMPSIDIALPAGKNDVETQPEKEKKVKIPKFDVSLPTMNPPEGKIEVEGLEFKGSKFHMPTIDISLPGGTGADAGPAAKGKTFEIPTVDVSLPKIKSPESEVDIDVHGIESGKIHMPSVDISLPGGGKGGKLDIEGPSGKGNKFKMPKLDVSLPKIRLSGSEFDTEDPKIKGEKIQMPSIEISLPAGKAGDVEAESQPEKGRKFEMPKFDVSLPKIKSLDDEIHVENPDFKGGKFHRPTLDISLPGGGTERETGKGKSFEIPKINVSIPNFRSSDYKIDTDIQNIEGKFHMPTVDISLPEGEKEKIDVKGPSGKGNTFKMPKLDVSLPKMRLSGSEFDTEGPEIKGGKMHKPSIEISLPVGNDDVNVEAKTGKGRKFEMPKVDASLPKIKSSEGEIDIDVHGIKSGKVKMPSVDISLPEGGKGEKVTIEGPSRKGNKFKMPKVDVSLPKMRLSGSEFDTEGPEIKGGKMNKPSIEISLPVGKADEIAVEDQPGKGKKVKIPKFEVSPPKTNSLEGKIEIEGPDFKGPKFHMPTIDISLPGGTGADAGPAAKGKTFEIPTVDVSLPKIKSPEGEIDTNIHKITGGKIHIPSVDISLPGGGKAEKLELEAPSGKANTFKIPTVDVSLPKVKSSGTEIQTEGLEVKGGKMQMPSIEISLPAGKAGDVDVDAKSGKGRKFEMPKFNVSPHKIKTPKGKIDVEGPEGGKFHVPTVDISLPGGTGADAGPVGKGKIFEIPTVDVSFPKIKSPGGEVDIDVHGIESGRIHIPSVDISLPEGGKGEKHNIEGPSGKGNLFKMPKVDVSLPKMRLSGSEVNIEGHEIKGGKFHVPTIDISLPKGKSGGDMNIDGHTNKGRTFKMPQFDIPLPKFKSEDKVDVEDAHLHMPSINVSLPEGEIGDDTGRVGKGNKFEMPKIGISLPKINSGIDVKGGIDYESAEIKGGRFHMPTVDITVPRGGIKGVVEPAGKGTKVDVTMPKVSSGEMNVKDPTFAKSGTIGMPAIEISIPKGKAGTNLPNKDERFNLPSTDISLTKEEITIEGNMKSGEQPKIDISQPGCKINATAPEMKAGQFNLPSVEISPPKVKLQDSELKVERLDKKEKKFQMPDIDISIPKISHSYDAGAKTPSLNTAEVTAGGNIKLPTMKIPTVDISAPKVDLEFTLPKGKGSDTEDIELLKAEGGRPSSGSSIDVPDVSVKMPKVSLPKFGAKWKGVEKETEVPGLSKDLESSSEETYSKNKKLKVKLPSVEASKDGTYSSDAEIELKGSGEITKPEFKTDSADSKLKPKVKLPKFISFTKSKLKDVELDITPMSMEKGKVKMPGVEIALPKSQIPECEILLPKSEVDVSEADIKGYEGNLKIPKMPSLPTVTLDEFNSSDRGKVIVPNVKIPKVDLSIPHGKTRDGAELETDSKEGKFKMPKMAIPTVDISLPKGQSTQKYDPELEGAQLNITLQTEKAGALDTAKQPNKGTEIKSGKLTTGNIQFPSVSIPHGKVNETGPYVEISAKGKKFKMPDVTVPFGGKGDASLPKLKTKKSASPLTPHGEGPEDSINDSKKTVVDISLPHLETVFSEEDRHFQMPEMKMPKIDISFSQAGAAERSELNVDTEKTKMTKVVTTSTIDQHRTTGESVSAQGVQFKISDFKMVKTDVSLTEERTREFHTTKIQVEGETGKHIKPTTSSKTSKQDTSVTLEHPNISASLKESHEEGKTDKECPKVIPEQELMPTKVGKKNKKKAALAEVDLSSDLPKKGTKGPKMKGTKFNIGMPKVKLSEESKAVKEEIHISKGDVDPKLTAFHKKVDPPKIPELDFDIEPVQIEIDTPEDDPKLTGKVKIPKFGIPLPSLTSAEARSLTPDAKYKDPSIPKVKKAVFVMVNPQAESSAGAVSPTSTEAEEERLKLPKIKMKPSFSKSHEKEKAIHYDEAENEGKLKSGKVKMPKVTFSSGKTESLEASPSMSEDGASLNSEKDEKATIGKLKLPRVEFFSPYTKDTREEETKSKEDSPQSKEPKKTKSDTMAFSGLKKKTGKNQNLEETGVLVSSKARTEMLAERDRSESPATPPGYVSETKWEREETTWFKVPKVTLSPHSTGILVITPEGSPKERKSTLPGSGEEASGGFYVKMPSIDFSTHEMSTEHRITTKEESRTVMTKVTKYTESKMSSSKQDAKEL